MQITPEILTDINFSQLIYQNSSVSFMSLEGFSSDPGHKSAVFDQLTFRDLTFEKSAILMSTQSYLNDQDEFTFEMTNLEFE